MAVGNAAHEIYASPGVDEMDESTATFGRHTFFSILGIESVHERPYAYISKSESSHATYDLGQLVLKCSQGYQTAAAPELLSHRHQDLTIPESLKLIPAKRT